MILSLYKALYKCFERNHATTNQKSKPFSTNTHLFAIVYFLHSPSLTPPSHQLVHPQSTESWFCGKHIDLIFYLWNQSLQWISLQAVLPDKQHPCQTQSSPRNQISWWHGLLREINRSLLRPKRFYKDSVLFLFNKNKMVGTGVSNSNLLMLFGLTGFEWNWFCIMDFHFALHLIQYIRKQTLGSNLTILLSIFLIGKWPNNILSASFKGFYVIKCDPFVPATFKWPNSSFIFYRYRKDLFHCCYCFLLWASCSH